MKRICLWDSLVLASVLIGSSGCATVMPRVSERVDSKSIQTELGLARIQEQQGQIGKAQELYENVLRRNKRVVEAHQRLAMIAVKSRDFATASKHFQAARQLQPNNASLLSDIASAQCAAGQLKQAERTARSALAVEPDHKGAQQNLALILGRQGRFEESFVAFAKGASEAEAHAHVASLYAQAGRIDEARQHESQFLALAHADRKSTDKLTSSSETEHVPTKTRAVVAHAIAAPEIDSQASAPATFEVAAPADQAAQADVSQVGSTTETNVVEEAAEIPSVAPSNDHIPDLIEISSSATEIRRSIPEAEPDAVMTETESNASSDANADQPVAAEPVKSLVSPCPAAEGAVLAAVARLDSEAKDQQQSALRQLGQLGSAAQAAAPACREMLNNVDTETRAAAAVALWKIAGETTACIPSLCAGLGAFDPEVQEICAWTLGEMGAAAEDALPALTTASSQSAPHMCILAAEAIAKIHPGNSGAIDTLIRALQDDDPNARLLAMYAVAGIAPQDRENVLNISQCLKDDDERVRAAAAFALGQIGPAAATATPGLEACRQDANDQVRASAELALTRIRGASKSESN